MSKAENRYLNLAGAPWSPTRRNRGVTLSNYFAAAASTALVFLATNINPSMEKNRLVYLFEGLAMSAATIYCARNRRKQEAQSLSPHHELLVIDTQPDAYTPPTPEALCQKVKSLKDNYKNKISPESLAASGIAALMAPIHITAMVTQSDPYAYVPFVSFFFVQGMDVAGRYRQLHKLHEKEWVIADQGDAVRHFQKEEAPQLANARGVVMAPANNR